MKKHYLSALLLTLTTTLFSQETGATLTDKTCSNCHLFSSSSSKLTDGKMGGPPMWGILKKVRNRYADKEAQIAFIADYAMHPTEEKMLFPAATREYFGVMPSMKDRVSKEEMQIIAKYLAEYQAVK